MTHQSTKVATTEDAALVAAVVEQYGSLAAVARATGVPRSRLSQARIGGSGRSLGTYRANLRAAKTRYMRFSFLSASPSRTGAEEVEVRALQIEFGALTGWPVVDRSDEPGDLSVFNARPSTTRLPDLP